MLNSSGMTKRCEPKKTSKTKSCRSFVARVKLPCSDCSWARWTRRKRCGSQQCMNWGYRFFCPLQPRLQQIVSLATFSNEDSHLFSTPPSPGPSWFLLAYTSQRLSSEKHLWWFWIRICASSLMCVVHWKIQDYESTHTSQPPKDGHLGFPTWDRHVTQRSPEMCWWEVCWVADDLQDLSVAPKHIDIIRRPQGLHPGHRNHVTESISAMWSIKKVMKCGDEVSGIWNSSS